MGTKEDKRELTRELLKARLREALEVDDYGQCECVLTLLQMMRVNDERYVLRKSRGTKGDLHGFRY